MKFLSVFLLSLVVLALSVGAVGEDKDSAAQNGSFITLKQSDGREFRAFVAGPADSKAAVLIVHDYFGISDATKQSVQRLGALGYGSVAVDKLKQAEQYTQPATTWCRPPTLEMTRESRTTRNDNGQKLPLFV